MAKQTKDKSWKIWDNLDGYSEILYKRATGELKEMESAKSLCKLIKPIYKSGMKVLDVGCGAGHYLRSLRARLDQAINYTGVDSTRLSIDLAKKAFGENFFIGDILGLKFKDKEFDLVMCNNVLLHLPPPPVRAIAELIRVAKKYVIIRTVFGARNYVIKEVRQPGEGSKKSAAPGKAKKAELFNPDGSPIFYNFFNLYTEDYIKQAINKINKKLKVKIIADDGWRKFDNRQVAGALATKIMGGKQVAGNLLLDWKFIVIKK